MPARHVRARSIERVLKRPPNSDSAGFECVTARRSAARFPCTPENRDFTHRFISPVRGKVRERACQLPAILRLGAQAGNSCTRCLQIALRASEVLQGPPTGEKTEGIATNIAVRARRKAAATLARSSLKLPVWAIDFNAYIDRSDGDSRLATSNASRGLMGHDGSDDS